MPEKDDPNPVDAENDPELLELPDIPKLDIIITKQLHRLPTSIARVPSSNSISDLEVAEEMTSSNDSMDVIGNANTDMADNHPAASKHRREHSPWSLPGSPDLSKTDHQLFTQRCSSVHEEAPSLPKTPDTTSSIHYPSSSQRSSSERQESLKILKLHSFRGEGKNTVGEGKSHSPISKGSDELIKIRVTKQGAIRHPLAPSMKKQTSVQHGGSVNENLALNRPVNLLTRDQQCHVTKLSKSLSTDLSRRKNSSVHKMKSYRSMPHSLPMPSGWVTDLHVPTPPPQTPDHISISASPPPFSKVELGTTQTSPVSLELPKLLERQLTPPKVVGCTAPKPILKQLPSVKYRTRLPPVPRMVKECDLLLWFPISPVSMGRLATKKIPRIDEREKDYMHVRGVIRHLERLGAM